MVLRVKMLALNPENVSSVPENLVVEGPDILTSIHTLSLN